MAVVKFVRSLAILLVFASFCGGASARYIGSDPIGLEGGINTYTYVESNPLQNSDADGLQSRSGPPPRTTPNQAILNLSGQNLLAQIRQYDPNFTFATAEPSDQGGYTRANLDALRAILLQYRQTNAPAPNWIVTNSGMCLPVPIGSGLVPNINRSGAITGQAFIGGTGGGNGLAPSVTQLRLMNPNAQNPTGYGVYMNSTNQGINPATGQTLPNSDPVRHIPF